MRLKFNGKQTKITTANNLTIKQYIALSQFEKLDIINYLSATTGFNISDIAAKKMTNRQLRKVYNYIGHVKSFKVLQKRAKHVDFIFFEGKYIGKELDHESVGVRIMVEQKLSETDNAIEIATYLLAIILAGNYDADDTEKIYTKLLGYAYVDVLPFALFFFKRLRLGSSPGSRLLNVFRKVFKTSMLSK